VHRQAVGCHRQKDLGLVRIDSFADIRRRTHLEEHFRTLLEGLHNLLGEHRRKTDNQAGSQRHTVEVGGLRREIGSIRGAGDLAGEQSSGYQGGAPRMSEAAVHEY